MFEARNVTATSFECAGFLNYIVVTYSYNSTGSIMLWGVICRHALGPLIHLEGKVSAYKHSRCVVCCCYSIMKHAESLNLRPYFK